MSWFKPRTIETISKTVRGDMRREIPGTDALIWPNSLAVLGKVFAMVAHLLELRAAWIAKQIFTHSADAGHVARHGVDYGIGRKGASRATGFIYTIGADNKIYPAGIAFLSGTDRYLTSSDVKSGAGGAVLLPVHSEAIGSATNRDPGETMSLVDQSLYPELNGPVTVHADGIGGGADPETDDSLRARILDRKRRPPQGGAYSDYEQFARNVPGVTKAWAHPFANGPGTIGVWFLFEGRDDGIPTEADVDIVTAYIADRRMVRAGLSVSAPIPIALDITISDLANDSEATRVAITNSLRSMLNDRARPGVAVDPFLLSRSWVAEAISVAVGEDRHSLTVPSADILYNDGKMPVLGVVTYE